MRTRLVAIALASFLTAALFTAGCGKNVEGETKSWNANKLELEKFAGKFPGLKAPIATHVDQAQKAYDAAQNVSDADQKAKALSVANDQLLLVLTPLRNLDRALLDIEALKKDQGLLSLSAGDVNPAIKLSDAGVAAAIASLDGKGVDTTGALVSKVEEALRMANNGASDLRSLKSRVEAAAKASADKAAADKAAADKAAADKAAATPPTPTPAPAPEGAAPAPAPEGAAPAAPAPEGAAPAAPAPAPTTP